MSTLLAASRTRTALIGNPADHASEMRPDRKLCAYRPLIFGDAQAANLRAGVELEGEPLYISHRWIQRMADITRMGRKNLILSEWL